MSGIKKYFVSPNPQNLSENVVVEPSSKKKQCIPHNKKSKKDFVKIDKSRKTSNSNEDESYTKTVLEVEATSGLITDRKNAVGNSDAKQKHVKTSHKVKGKPKISRCLSGDARVKGELQNENEAEACSQNSSDMKSDTNNDYEECYDFNAKTNHCNEMNAFQYMMHARNKSIGTNSPGKQKKETEILKDQNKDVLVKRRIKFEAWAAEKGGLKRKLTDELIDTQIKQEMNKRAKRLKKLLTRTCDQKNLGLEEADLENESLKPSDNKNLNIIKEQILSPSLQSNLINPKGKLSHTRNINMLDKIHVIEDDDNIDEEFLSKLNSPIKNNKSLLCYFEKIKAKSNNENNSDQNLKLASNANSEIVNNKSPALRKTSTGTSTPKFRQKPGTPSSKWKIRLVNSKYNCNDSDDDNSCVDLCDSVSDTEMLSIQTKSKKHKGESLCISDSSPIETNSSGLDLQKGKKLAPLFEKSLKCIPDLNVKAKEEFLKSGVPEKILVSQRQEILNQPPIFPLISHVQQKNMDSHIWNLSQFFDIKYRMVETCFEFSPQNSSLLIGTFTDCKRPASSEYRHNNINAYSPPKHINKPKDTLINIKLLFPEFPVYKTFRILKQKFENTADTLATNYISNNLGEEIIKKKTQKSSEKIRISKNQNASSKGRKMCCDEKLLLINTKQILWSDIFCPSSSNEIIGNKIAITSLMNWLVAWKDFSSTKDNLNYDSGSNYDSDADFIDNESIGNNTNHKSLKNTALLLGPTGCGKTSAVYALANELGYNVIELNASSKRTGKIVLSKLREATQSHRVRNIDNVYSHNIQDTNKLSSIEKKKIKKTYQRCAVPPALQKEAKLPSDNSKREGPSKVLSLILVEDIDVVFEQDDGFISALFQIVQTSKRPIVFTSNNESNSNVQKFMNCLAIYFKPAKPEVMTTWLQILCLVNNLHISSTSIHQLLDIYKGDLRRTLLQLQYWVLSGGDPNSITNNNKQDIGSICTTKIITTEHCNQTSSAADERSQLIDDLELHSDEAPYPYSIEDKDCSKSEYSACHKKCIICTCSHENSNACKDLFTLEYLWFRLSAADLHSQFKMTNVNSKNPRLNAFSQLIEFFDTMSYIDNVLAKIQIIKERDEQSYVVNLYTISEFLISYAYSKTEVDPHVYHKSKHDDERFHQNIRSNINALSSATNEVIQNPLNQYQPLQRPKYSKTFALDYGPALRAICRSEKQRNDVNVKRITSNRFYHYLKTLGVCFTEDMLNFACNSLC